MAFPSLEIEQAVGLFLGQAAGAPTPAAIAILERICRIDLLFTDVVPRKGMNGTALAREALRRRPALKVLYMSGYTANAIIHHGVLEKGVHLLTKPFRNMELARKVRGVLDDGA